MIAQTPATSPGTEQDIHVRYDKITLCAKNLLSALKGQLVGNVSSTTPNIAIDLVRKVALKAARNGSKSNQSSDYLIKALARSHLWNRELFTGKVKSVNELKIREKISSPTYIRRILRLQFLAPDITEAIITGNHSKHLTFERLLKASHILDWNGQRQLLSL